MNEDRAILSATEL